MSKTLVPQPVNSVIACPCAQHLTRTAAEIEHSGPRFQTQRRAESGELFGGERVMDAVSTFGDVEDSWNVHCRNPLRSIFFGIVHTIICD